MNKETQALVITMEECGELTQRCSKMMRKYKTLDQADDEQIKKLTEEVGEVARIIARRYGEQSEKESDKNKDLGEEFADVVFVVMCLANQTGIDLQVAFDKKMDLKTNRDHNRHHNNEKLK